jgi:hypothetical protein
MMNFERLTNATGAIGVTGRALLEAKVRASRRGPSAISSTSTRSCGATSST